METKEKIMYCVSPIIGGIVCGYGAYEIADVFLKFDDSLLDSYFRLSSVCVGVTVGIEIGSLVSLILGNLVEEKLKKLSIM